MRLTNNLNLVMAIFFLLSGHFIMSQSNGGVANFNYNLCQNQVTFRVHIEEVYNGGGVCAAGSFANRTDWGNVDLIVNGVATRVIEIVLADGVYSYSVKNGSSAWLSWDNTEDNVSCVASSGKRYKIFADVTVNLPADKSGDGQLFQVEYNNKYDGSNKSWNSGNQTAPNIPRVVSPLAAEPLCDGVELTWNKPSFSCTNASYVIYRNGSYVGEVDFNTLKWKDNNVNFVPDNEHEYEVVVRHNSDVRDYGLPTSIEGNPILNFDSPDYFESVSLDITNLCSQSVRLQWTINEDVDINYFEVERGETDQFINPFVNTVTQTFGTIAYDDQNIPVNQDYYYRIKAYDNCSNEVYIRDSDIQHIMFEGPPSQPRIQDIITATDGSDKAVISWSYPEDGTPVDYYQVYRDGSPRSEKLSPDTFSYEDDGLSNCLQFEYMVVAGKECFDEANSMRVQQIISFNTDLNGFDELNASKYYYNDRVTVNWDITDDNAAEEVVVYRKREGSEDTPEILKRMPINSSSFDDFDTDAGVLYRYGLLAVSCTDYEPTLAEMSVMMTTVGIRSETGIINGKITYDGGNAVEGVRVIATPSDGENRGVSVDMTGNQLTIPLEDDGFNYFPDEWTFSFWFRLHDKSAGQTILNVGDGSDYLTISPNPGGQTEFYNIDYREESAIVGVEDELVGYEQTNGEVLSLKDGDILGKIDGDDFISYKKTEIAGLASDDTIYHFQTKEPWLLNQSNEWFELSFQTTSVATPDSLIGYLRGDSIYEDHDSDFVLAFIDDNDELVIANHFNISYELGATYAYIQEGQMVFADDPDTKGNVIGDIVYSHSGYPIHLIDGDNIFYAYEDQLTQKLVRGKRFARMVPNDSDPEISFDILLINEVRTEEIRKGEVLGSINAERTEVFESGGLGLIQYLIDDGGVLRTATYQDQDIYIPEGNALFNTQGYSLVDIATGIEKYLFSASGDSLYAISLDLGFIDETGFVRDAITGEHIYYLGEEVSGERQVFKAIDEQVNYIINDTTETYFKEAFQAQLAVNTSNLGSESIMLSPELYLGEYNNLLLTYDGNELIYFVNGLSVDTILTTGLTQIFRDANEIVFGDYAGLQDETLLWSEAKDSAEVKLDFNRYLSGGQEHLIGYWRIDENVGLDVYDASYSLDNTGKKVFNERHATIDIAQWSNIVPEQEDLSFTAFTDQDGNYSIQSIIYAGSGNNFKVVPILGTHRFEPANKILFLGPSLKIQNEQDFRDKSAFRVTGTVKYDPKILGFEDREDLAAPNCYVEGVNIYIDDQPVLAGNAFVETDQNGRFEIDMPIGKHHIKVVKNKHTFVESYWPPVGTYNFQGDVNDLLFYDNTTRTLLGKVVGGTTEGGKTSGSGESKNNIGVAEIKLKSIGKTCFETTIATDSTTGEYIADLPPFRYNIVDLSIPSQTDAFNHEFKRLAEASIDLSRDDLEVDSVKCEEGCDGVDSIGFHLQRDFTYRSPSEFIVKQYRENGTELVEIPGLLGAEEYVVNSSTTLDFRNGSPFPYEIFTVDDYTWGITLVEKYENRDSLSINPTNQVIIYNDTIKTGEILIDNEIADESVVLSLAEGEVIYKFLSGEPSILLDRQNPELSFTKAVQIIGPNTNWRDDDNIFRGIVLGTSQDESQNSFYTLSEDQYQIVDLILRDPPGSQSFTEFLQKTKMTKIRTTSLKRGLEHKSSIKVGAKLDAENPLTGTKTIKHEHTVGADFETNQYRTAEETSIISFEEGIELTTSDENLNTGAGSDIFVGNALNVFYSPSYNLDIIPLSECGEANECYDISFQDGGIDYAFSRSKSLSLVTEESTLFYYTQRQIEQLIDELERDINSVDNSEDSTVMANQIRIWKSAIAQNEYEKLMAKDIANKIKNGNTEDGWRYENISFAYGTDIEKSYELGVQNNFEYSQEFSWYAGFNLHIHTFVLGPLVEFDLQIGNAVYATAGSAGQSDYLQSTVVHFEDNDPGDQYSVDMVLSGVGHSAGDGVSEMDSLYNKFNSGALALPTSADIEHVDDEYTYVPPSQTDYINPIFLTLGGRTACPHEPEEKTRFLEYLDPNYLEVLKGEGIIVDYQPHASGESNRYEITESSAQDYVLNYGTFQRDQPGLRIEPRVQRDIPFSVDNRATFDIIFDNLNVEDTVRTYQLLVDQRTTGAGPTMRLDGERFIKGTNITLYGGEQLRKQFTLRPLEGVYDYEDIVIYLVAGCQFDFGADLDFQEDIFAMDTISAYFTPTCPIATVITPTDGWIVNDQTGPELQVEIQEQSYFFDNHDKVKLQFKATYQSDEDWVDAAVWSRDSVEVEEQVTIGEDYFYFPVDNHFIVYNWNADEYNLPDGNYHIRWEYHCTNGLESFSAPINGVIDRTSPHAFGRPSPADGVLSPSDEIILTLNEPIEAGLVDRDFIEVQGKINNTDLVHTASVRFSDSESDQVVIPNIQLRQTPVTMEMWVRLDQEFATSEQEIFYHGESGGTELSLRLLSNGKLQFSLNDMTVESENPVPLDVWSHIAFSIDPTENKASLYHNGSLVGFNETFVAMHFAEGPIVLGGEGIHSFTGNVHELRLWNTFMAATDLAENFHQDLTGREIGLVGYWPLNEGKGDLGQEMVQARHAQINAGWWSEPSSLTFDFTGTNHVGLPSAAFAIDEDFSVEFWFKSDGTSTTSAMNLFSNGNIDQLDWDIVINTLGQIVLHHNENEFVLVSQSVLDQKWHHFALVVNRVGNTIAYLDQETVFTRAADEFVGFGGPDITLGAKSFYDIDLNGDVVQFLDNHFMGQMDEFRIWRMAKQAEQVERMAGYKLEGNEFGLVCYLPFETYDDFLRISQGTLKCWDETASGIVAISEAESYSPENPGITLKPYETPVYFNYAVNGDKIIITLDEDNPASVENCVLDISVRNLVDQNGNVMKSPVTWSVFVDRNQVTWNDRLIAMDKMANDPLTFTSTITNSGGNTQDFVIDNLPTWLTATPSSGAIDPDSEQEIEFVVNSGLNIGEYQQPIHLRTDFGFNEALLVDLKVLAQLPVDWTFTPEDFQYSMSFIGQIKIDDYFSKDDEDQIAVFVNDSLRGIAPISYQEVYDNYQAFLSVYSNDPGGNETLEFRIWDASEGKVLTGITIPDIDQDPILFAQNEIFGRPSSPVTFHSANKIMTTMNIPNGWKWVSFNLESGALERSSNIFAKQKPSEGDRLLSIDAVDVYDAQNDLWIGSLAGDNLPPSTGGIDVTQGYRVYLSEPLQVQLIGTPVKSLENTIHIYSENSSIKPRMWNWISFLGTENMEVNEALSSIQAEDGDIIKSQYEFAIYDPVLKWVGNLTYLAPGEGYMIQVASDQQLTYPQNGLINATSRKSEAKMLHEEVNFDPHQYSESMNMIVQVLGLDLNADSPMLNVYSGGELRGVAQLTQIGDKELYYLTVYGEATEAIDFTLKIADQELELDYPMEFTSSSVKGTHSDPVIMNFVPGDIVNFDAKVYPNPFSDHMNFVFKLDDEGFGQIRVFSLEGKLLIDREFIGNKEEVVTFEWDGTTDFGAVVKKGTYLLQVQTNDQSKDLLLIKE